jgi:hypothetical protein
MGCMQNNSLVRLSRCLERKTSDHGFTGSGLFLLEIAEIIPNFRPSVQHRPFEEIEQPKTLTNYFSQFKPTPNQTRWNPYPLPASNDKVDFVQVGFLFFFLIYSEQL